MNTKPHFTALLTYIANANGPRSTPASSGHRAFIKFDFSQEMIIAIQNFTDSELVFPGDTVTAEVTLINAEPFLNRLYQGLDFDFFEADTLIGSGVVKKLLI